MTRVEAIIQQLGALERHMDRALAKSETKERLKDGYCNLLEDRDDIMAGMLADALDCSKGEVVKMVDDAYEVRQAARKVVAT